MHPIELEKVDYFTNGYSSTVELNFRVISGGVLNDLELDKIRFYLGGLEFVSQELYLFLHRYVTEIEVSIPTPEEKDISFKLDKSSIASVGFSEDENILPKHQNVFHGYMLMQEYFCYRDKFNFVDIKGFEKLRGLKSDILDNQKEFRVSIHFDRHLSIADDLQL